MSPRQRPTLRLPGLVVIESSAFATPFLADDDHVVDVCAWLSYEVSKWLPGAETIICFPPDTVLSNWARGIQQRLAYIGVRTSTRDRIASDRLRTRMLWHAVAENERVERLRLELAADREHRFQIRLGEMVEVEVIAASVIEHAAIVAFPTGVYDDEVLPDEEPF